MNLEDLSTYALLEMYEDEIKRMHYDPCSGWEPNTYNMYQLREEIERRLAIYEEHRDSNIHNGFEGEY